MDNMLSLQDHLARTVGRELYGNLELVRVNLAALAGLKASMNADSAYVFLGMIEAIPTADAQELDAIFSTLLRY